MITSGNPVLSSNPDWHGAARLLLSGFRSMDNLDDRVRLLDKLSAKLDCGLYPAFLQILFYIENTADEPCKNLIADTFLHAITSGRMPEGKVPAWGAVEPIGDSAYGHTRRLGPIEFTCAWYAQPGSLPEIDRTDFKSVTASLIRLFSINRSAHRLYCQKLIADSNDTISGTLSASTRNAIFEMAQQWAAHEPADQLIESFIAKTEQNGSTLRHLSGNPFG